MESSNRNSLEDANCLLKPVDDFALFTGFSCGRDDLDDYIRNDAQTHDRELLSKTYSFHLKDGAALSLSVAFVSLANDAVRLANRKKQRVFPANLQYRAYPAVKICRLGTRQEHHGQGIGSYMLWALKCLFLSGNRTGCRFVTVDAYNDPPTVSFYQRNDF
ncbi:GNAT family N-acetyltransferase [Fundidesulfovibrio butyratiphilus]